MPQRQSVETNIHELAQAVATLEVVLSALGAVSLSTSSNRRAEFVRHVQAKADEALYQRDGLEPYMLDRIARFIRASSPERS
jgi:hypothetical protein